MLMKSSLQTLCVYNKSNLLICLTIIFSFRFFFIVDSGFRHNISVIVIAFVHSVIISTVDMVVCVGGR